MSRKKKSMIGVDPLAWLEKEKHAADGVASDSEGLKNEPMSNARPSEDSDKVAVFNIMFDEAALSKGYELFSECLMEVMPHFYATLFEQQPEVIPLFSNFSEADQSEKFIQLISFLVKNIHDENALKSKLSELGKRHQTYGVLEDHYAVVTELLLKSLKDKLGRRWTKAVNKAWSDLLTVSAGVMCAAYEVQAVEKDVLAEKIEADSGSCLRLNSVQDISKSQDLKNDMLALINNNNQINIEAGDVERIDGSAMQLICALFIYARQNNLSVGWVNPSDAIIEAADILGMTEVIELSEQ